MPKAPKRPRVKTIILEVEGRKPIRIPGEKVAALFFDDHGVSQILADFYIRKGEHIKAKDMLVKWFSGTPAIAEAKTLDGDDKEPIVIVKDPDCGWSTLP